MIKVLTNSTVVIILQCIHILNQQLAHLKPTQY